MGVSSKFQICVFIIPDKVTTYSKAPLCHVYLKIYKHHNNIPVKSFYKLNFTLGIVLVTSIVSRIQFSETFPCFLENLLETGNNCIKKLHALHILKAVYPAVLDCLWLDWMCGFGLWIEGVEFNGKWLLSEFDKKMYRLWKTGAVMFLTFS